MDADKAAAAKLIALDWGSTGLRAFLLNTQGEVVAVRTAQLGASSMQGAAAYAATLQELVGVWMRAAEGKLPVLACGMVGSKHGWLEVPYVVCPASTTQLAQGLGAVESVHIVPGMTVNSAGTPPDLMRGEETQLVGALQLHPELVEQACIVMPGTHSKWAQKADDEAAFLAGVHAARDHGQLGLGHQLFAVRSLGVTEQMPASGLAEYMSGLLIGHELKAGLAWRSLAGLAQAPLVLIGESDLCRRYQQALLSFNHCQSMVLPNTAPAGLWRLAIAAGLI